MLIGHTTSTLPSALVRHASYALSVLGQGTRGVSVFFVISGFLITRLLLREHRATGTISLRRFYARRVLRIFPAFYTFLIALAVLALLGRLRLPWVSMLAAATFTWNYAHPPGAWWLGHVWSLCIEEQFYLTWPILLAWRGRKGAWIAVGVIAAEPVVRTATYFLAPAERPYLSIMLHTRADMLMFGCLAALWWDEPWFTAALARVFRSGVNWLLLLVSFVLGPWLETRYGGAYLMTVGYTIDGLAITLLMAWLLTHSRSGVGRLFNWRPVVELGVLSYSLYLWQQLFCTPENTTLLGRFPINIVAALAAAFLSYRLVERPFLRLKNVFAPARTLDSAQAP